MSRPPKSSESPPPLRPRCWTGKIQAALLQVIALAQCAIAYTRSWAANCPNERIRLAGNVEHLEQEVALLREEIRIKDARMASIPPSRRPRYEPTERLAILELRAGRGWSLEQTAKVFQVTAPTVSSWGQRLDEHGPGALLGTPSPLNKYPDFVRAAVQRLQVICPTLGKLKIAQILARAGLHLATTTVGRICRQPPTAGPEPLHRQVPAMRSAKRIVTADHPNHVWHADFTIVPTNAGFWTPWLPFALPHCWPFCWWVAVVVDHYSRKALGFAVFKRQPTFDQTRHFLGQLIAKLGVAPKYLITDSGTQFTADGFQPWCQRHGIRHRKGAVDQSGSIAIVERFIRTLKDGGMRVLAVVPMRHDPSATNSAYSSTGTTNRGPIRPWEGPPPTKSISNSAPPIARLASSLAFTGHAARPAPRPKPSSKASPASNFMSTSSSLPAAVICRS